MSWGQGIWRHYLSTDVGFVVEKAFYVKEKDLWKLRVSWINLGICHDPQPISITQRIDIPGYKRSEWIRTSGKQIKITGGYFK